MGDHRGDGVKGEEPSTGLVYTLCDEVRREGSATLQQFLILEGVV